MKTIKELGFYAKGMILVIPNSDKEYNVTNLYSVKEQRIYRSSFLIDMDEKEMLVEIDGVHYFSADTDWSTFSSNVVCKNWSNFIADSNFRN